MSLANEPAYPVVAPDHGPVKTGLTIRQEFAKEFMASMLGHPELHDLPSDMAEFSLHCADALIAELEKESHDA